MTIEHIWSKGETKHLPGVVNDTSGLADSFGFEVVCWDSLGTERENLGQVAFEFCLSQSC